jgi:hypothetical protein
MQLIYRGQTFPYPQRPAIVEDSTSNQTNATIVTLRYRGQTYTRNAPATAPYQPPRMMTW